MGHEQVKSVEYSTLSWFCCRAGVMKQSRGEDEERNDGSSS